MFCFDLLNDHAIVPASDSPDDRRDAVLAHLLNGKCVSTSHTPSCKLLARDSISKAHLSHLLCVLLLEAYQSKMIVLNVFSICCASIGLHATTSRAGRELMVILQRRLRHQKPIIECQSVFDVLNKLEQLGIGSLSELASFHNIQPDPSTKDAVCDAIVQHLITGTCEGSDGEMCYSTRVAWLARSKTVNLQMHILTGVVKEAPWSLMRSLTASTLA